MTSIKYTRMVWDWFRTTVAFEMLTTVAAPIAGIIGVATPAWTFIYSNKAHPLIFMDLYHLDSEIITLTNEGSGVLEMNDVRYFELQELRYTSIRDENDQMFMKSPIENFDDYLRTNVSTAYPGKVAYRTKAAGSSLRKEGTYVLLGVEKPLEEKEKTAMVEMLRHVEIEIDYSRPFWFIPKPYLFVHPAVCRRKKL